MIEYPRHELTNYYDPTRKSDQPVQRTMQRYSPYYALIAPKPTTFAINGSSLLPSRYHLRFALSHSRSSPRPYLLLHLSSTIRSNPFPPTDSVSASTPHRQPHSPPCLSLSLSLDSSPRPPPPIRLSFLLLVGGLDGITTTSISRDTM